MPKPVRDYWCWSDAVAVGFTAALVETTFVLTPLESFRTLEMTTSLEKHKEVFVCPDVFLYLDEKQYHFGGSWTCVNCDCLYCVFGRMHTRL